MGGRRWCLAQCLCEVTRQPTMWRNDDVVVPRRRREVVSNVYIDAIVGITTDETIAFDIADDDLCAAALSCDANDVDLRHPLHPLVDAWEYIVGSTMYGKQDRTQGVGGAGEASTRTTTKTETFPGKGGVSRGAGGGIALGRIPNDNQPRRAGGGGVSHNTGGRGVSWGARGGRGEAGGRIRPPRSRLLMHAWGNQRRPQRGRPSHCTFLPWQCRTRGLFIL